VQFKVFKLAAKGNGYRLIFLRMDDDDVEHHHWLPLGSNLTSVVVKSQRAGPACAIIPIFWEY
jgi:hypothetical protein